MSEIASGGDSSGPTDREPGSEPNEPSPATDDHILIPEFADEDFAPEPFDPGQLDAPAPTSRGAVSALKVPPHSIEAEQSVLGGLMLDNDAWFNVAEVVLATDFYQILETSDVPAGVVNIITGPHQDLAPVLAKHDNIDGIWYHGSADLSRDVEDLSADNIKRTWVNHGRAYDWFDNEQGAGEHLLRHATEVKNIWLPYGDQI